MRGGRSFERPTNRRREQGDGPTSFGRRLAGRRGVSDPRIRSTVIARISGSLPEAAAIQKVKKQRR
jgi:hypothetical protein